MGGGVGGGVCGWWGGVGGLWRRAWACMRAAAPLSIRAARDACGACGACDAWWLRLLQLVALPSPLAPELPRLLSRPPPPAGRSVASGPMVRSSYKAGEFFLEAMIKGDRGVTAGHHGAGPGAAASGGGGAPAEFVTSSGIVAAVPEL